MKQQDTEKSQEEMKTNEETEKSEMQDPPPFFLRKHHHLLCGVLTDGFHLVSTVQMVVKVWLMSNIHILNRIHATYSIQSFQLQSYVQDCIMY